jgi:hypothetical protein
MYLYFSWLDLTAFKSSILFYLNFGSESGPWHTQNAYFAETSIPTLLVEDLI